MVSLLDLQEEYEHSAKWKKDVVPMTDHFVRRPRDKIRLASFLYSSPVYCLRVYLQDITLPKSRQGSSSHEHKTTNQACQVEYGEEEHKGNSSTYVHFAVSPQSQTKSQD